MRYFATITLFATLLAAALPAQDWDKREAKLDRQATLKLLAFARTATNNEVLNRAKEAYELIITYYDDQNDKAHRAMGHEKQDGVWKLPEIEEDWPDLANDEERFKVIGAWKEVAELVGGLHRELGMEMLDKDPERSRRHLEMAIYYNPFDGEAHEAIGHEAFEEFWGTDEEIAFVERMREIEKFCAVLSKKEYEVEAVEALPVPFQRMVDADPDIEFHGARSESITLFIRGTQENANDCVQWFERGIDFLHFILPKAEREKIDFRQFAKRYYGWLGFVWTRAEQEAFVKLNPELRGSLDFANVMWGDQGRFHEVARALTPVSMFDHLIAEVITRYAEQRTGKNHGSTEGLMHAATWYMRATAITRHGAHKEGTTTGEKVTLPDSASWWMRKVRDQAVARTDFPTNGIPRVQLSDFRNDARIKTWSWMVWLLARYPDKWLTLFQKLPESEKRPFPNQVDDIYQEVFETSRESMEEEWRRWASGRTLVSYATGYGPPLLPEAPTKDQLKALERLNGFRELLGLPPCEIDLEATIGCRDHAIFLQQNEDHWKWPEAHEEDPSKPGFTTRGMRAGMQSVIILSPSGDLDAPGSLDGWMGTPYHRFPLIEHNIRRIGFALEDNVAVLDMGSLEDGRAKESEEKFAIIKWPAPRMENVPTAFHANEHPDPLADTPEGRQQTKECELQQKAGYPISAQFAYHMVNKIQDVKMELWTAKKSGREMDRKQQVDCWMHTPKVPLLKRQEQTGVAFLIPKERLEKKQWYMVELTLIIQGEESIVRWYFKTGAQRTGHGKLKVAEEKD